MLQELYKYLITTSPAAAYTLDMINCGLKKMPLTLAATTMMHLGILKPRAQQNIFSQTIPAIVSGLACHSADAAVTQQQKISCKSWSVTTNSSTPSTQKAIFQTYVNSLPTSSSEQESTFPREWISTIMYKQSPSIQYRLLE